tara:strand:+ start:76 stop:384 length:309 start_codon:yes stop_codon:yes gene_type:complete
MEKNNKHNGYTNYATWRVYLEFFSDNEQMYCECLEDLKEERVDFEREAKNRICTRLETDIENYIISNSNQNLVQDYAFAFLQDVNYYEIAEHIYDNYLIEQE